MTAVTYRGLADLRRHWRAAVAIALLVGVLGTVVFSALAGARRSSSAFSRFREVAQAADGTILTSDEAGMAEIASLPEVAAVGRIVVPFLAPLASGKAARHRLVTTPGGFVEDVDGVRVLRGRFPDADREDEVALNERLADAVDATLGEKLRLQSFSPEQIASEEGAGRGPLGPEIDVTVVGVVRSTFDVSDEITEDRPSGYLSPAFYRRFGDEVASFDQVYRVRLRDAVSDAPAFGEAVERILADDPDHSYAPDSTEVARVEDTIRVIVVGLTLFGIAAGMAGLSALGQFLSVTVGRLGSDDSVLASLGMSRSQRLAATMLVLAPGLAAGVALAAFGTYLASPLMPVNLARLAEPSPGYDFDGLVIGVGCLTLAALGAAFALLAAWRRTRENDWQALEASPRTRSSLPTRLAVAFRWSPVATTGAHMAFSPGRGRTAVPVRSAVAGAVAGVASVVAVLVFLASLHTLTRTPELYGWNWDAAVLSPDFESGSADADSITEELEADSAITDLTKVRVSHAVIGGRYLHVLGFSDLKGKIEPTVVEGRAPIRPDEVAVGSATMKQLGLSVGGRVLVDGVDDKQSLRVVGRVVIPYLGTDAIADEGVTMTGEGADRLATTQSSFELLLNWRIGAGAVAGPRVEELAGGIVREKPPTDVTNLDRISGIPRALGVFLGAVAAMAVSYALMATVRRRAGDLAVLRALGFRPRQVAATVVWQATLLVSAGLVIGLPLGVAAGRWIWTLVASAMGLANRPSIPWLGILATIPVAVAMANLVALIPARTAAVADPAAALRSE